jgi:hypothetical protein
MRTYGVSNENFYIFNVLQSRHARSDGSAYIRHTHYIIFFYWEFSDFISWIAESRFVVMKWMQQCGHRHVLEVTDLRIGHICDMFPWDLKQWLAKAIRAVEKGSKNHTLWILQWSLIWVKACWAFENFDYIAWNFAAYHDGVSEEVMGQLVHVDTAHVHLNLRNVLSNVWNSKAL